ncbi:MAG: hypothetical protein GH155_06880 [Spirochaeta sp.]|nr:hypothetical protein [Spirochaeta sp.]
MAIKNQDIVKLVEKSTLHYINNIYNRHIRKAFMTMQISRATWETLERFTDNSDYYKVQGYQFQEIYEYIHAAATFVYHARMEVLPNLKSLLAGGSETMLSRPRDGGSDLILRKMAINNFGANLGIFADIINELYIQTVALDKEEHQGRRAVYERIDELKNIGQLLI